MDKYKNTSTIGTLNNLRLGDNMFEDVNKDGKLTEEDLVYLGTDDPKVQFSINAGLEWNGFDLAIVFQGAGKRTIWREESTWGEIPLMRAVYLKTRARSCNRQYMVSPQSGGLFCRVPTRPPPSWRPTFMIYSPFRFSSLYPKLQFLVSTTIVRAYTDAK